MPADGGGRLLTRPVLLWDGSCGFCRAWVRRVRRWDRHDRIETLRSAERQKYDILLRISDDALDHAMHLVLPDGRVFAGGRAVPEILRLLPRGRLLVWLWWIPGVTWLSERAYAWVAARRHRLGCEVDGER